MVGLNKSFCKGIGRNRDIPIEASFLSEMTLNEETRSLSCDSTRSLALSVLSYMTFVLQRDGTTVDKIIFQSRQEMPLSLDWFPFEVGRILTGTVVSTRRRCIGPLIVRREYPHFVLW